VGIHFDTSEVDDLADDLRTVPRKATQRVSRVVDDEAKSLRNTWRSNARRSAGRHGKHYPRAITNERTGLMEQEIGPDSAMPQGGMSFEFGSRNQPPHLDGSRAADKHAPEFVRAVEAAIDRVDLL
jgi:hypothetical protein